MTTTFTLKQHDTLPRFQVTLLDDDVPVDLLFLDVARLIIKNLAGIKVNALMTPLDQSVAANRGILYYDWAASDTDTAGTYQAEIEVRWINNGVQTFPGASYLRVKILKDLDDPLSLFGGGVITNTGTLTGG